MIIEYNARDYDFDFSQSESDIESLFFDKMLNALAGTTDPLGAYKRGIEAMPSDLPRYIIGYEGHLFA